MFWKIGLGFCIVLEFWDDDGVGMLARAHPE